MYPSTIARIYNHKTIRVTRLVHGETSHLKKTKLNGRDQWAATTSGPNLLVAMGIARAYTGEFAALARYPERLFMAWVEIGLPILSP